MKKKLLLSGIAASALLGILAVTALFFPGWLRIDAPMQPAASIVGQMVDPMVFLASDNPAISVSYEGLMDFSYAGRQPMALELRQPRRLMQRAYSVLYIAQPVAYYTVELGASILPAPLDFIANRQDIPAQLLDVHFNGAPPMVDTLPVGVHPVTLVLNGAAFTSAIAVVDTTPPIIYTQDITREMGQALCATDFVTAVYDESPIAALVLLAQPDYFIPGAHTVEVRATDVFGNYAIAAASVTFLPNTVPPTIIGTQNIYAFQGEPIRFREGVSAYDAFGRALHFDIDNTQVNVHERGIYPATFTATDAWGLATTAQIYVHVLSVDPATVYDLADAVLAQILRDDMTQLQQTSTIFHWLQNNISFAGGGVVYYSAHEAAHQGFIQRRGNCAVFAAMMEILLTRAEIPVLPMIRTRYFTGLTRHRWVLANPDNLGWHHVDATPNLMLTRNQRFMFTQSGAVELTEYVRRQVARINDFYVFDDDLHPGIVITP